MAYKSEVARCAAEIRKILKDTHANNNWRDRQGIKELEAGL